MTHLYRSLYPLQELIVRMNKDGASRRINLEDNSSEALFEKITPPNESDSTDESLYQIDR
jgi:hypothetical protein